MNCALVDGAPTNHQSVSQSVGYKKFHSNDPTLIFARGLTLNGRPSILGLTFTGARCLLNTSYSGLDLYFPPKIIAKGHRFRQTTTAASLHYNSTTAFYTNYLYRPEVNVSSYLGAQVAQGA